MNAAVVQSFATAPVHTTFDTPVAKEGEHLVTVKAAALHQIVKALANGSHYGSTGELPFIPDGSRIYFGVGRPPYGSFAQQTIAAPFMLVPLPDAISDATAAGIANPAMSSWVALTRAQFTPGESILILGATGTSGQLAVQIAKRRGASRIVAAGRNPEALAKLKSLGADTVISLDQEPAALLETFRAEFAQGISIVLDYLWGQPAESVLAAISQKGLKNKSSRIRYVNIGSTAGHNISLPAATLRSSGLELLGSGFGSASMEQIRQAITEFFTLAAQSPFDFSLKTAPLSEVTTLWNEKEQATRIVFLP